jgi:hypothetical protein
MSHIGPFAPEPASNLAVLGASGLDHRIRLFVPGTVGRELAAGAQRDWAEHVAAGFTARFGGSTSFSAMGSWADGRSVIREPVIVVESFATASELKRSLPEVTGLCRELGASMQQEFVALEVDGILWAIKP